jgi:hypothetical protein
MTDTHQDYNWLDKMQSFLTWSIKGPEFDNPYASPISDKLLVAMIENFEILQEHITVRCTCDGAQILTIRNLAKPIVKTDHPCVNSLTQLEILMAAERLGVPKIIVDQASRIREVLLRELRERQKTKRSVKTDNSGKTMAEIKRELEAHKKAAKANIKSSMLEAPAEMVIRLVK